MKYKYPDIFSDNKNMKRFFLLSCLFFNFFFNIYALPVKISYTGSKGYTLVERTNLRRYINGKYSGLTSREVRSFISPAETPENVASVFKVDRWYDGNFYVMEETLRNSREVAAGIHEAIPSGFHISPDGKMTMVQDNGYPTFRSFPSYTTQQLKEGDSWKAAAERAVDPLNKGIFTRIPIQVLYTFSGAEIYKDEPVYRIKALWQTNYGFSNFIRDPKGDSSLQKATGGHKADIIVSQKTGAAILIIDNVDENFLYEDGTVVNFKGTITLFTEYPPAVDRNKILLFLNRVAVEKKSEPVPAGTKIAALTTKNTGVPVLPSADSSVGQVKAQESVQVNDLAKLQEKGQPTVQSDRSKNLMAKSENPSAKTDSTKNEKPILEKLDPSYYENDIALVTKNPGNSKNSDDSENKQTQKSQGIPEPQKSEIASVAGQPKVSAEHGGQKQIQPTDTIIPHPEFSEIKKASSGTAKELPLSEKPETKQQKQESPNIRTGIPEISSASKNNSSQSKKLIYEETPAGLRLSVRDIKFKPDSAEVLPTEKERLDEIAEVLKLAPESQFLIEGHTAKVGNPTGEQVLSVQRAKKIAAELSERGIPSGRFICRGWGGKKPVADNSSDEGKAQNRRVEITILE